MRHYYSFNKSILSLLLAFPLILGGEVSNNSSLSFNTQEIAQKKGKDKGRGQREGGGKYRRDNSQKQLIRIDHSLHQAQSENSAPI